MSTDIAADGVRRCTVRVDREPMVSKPGGFASPGGQAKRSAPMV